MESVKLGYLLTFFVKGIILVNRRLDFTPTLTNVGKNFNITKGVFKLKNRKCIYLVIPFFASLYCANHRLAFRFCVIVFHASSHLRDDG